MDYRELLKKYMAHVFTNEGTTFMGDAHTYGGFTEEELAELRKLDKEIE